jgi:hypothetical protein
VFVPINVYFDDIDGMRVGLGHDGRARVSISAYGDTVSLDRATLQAALRKLGGDTGAVPTLNQGSPNVTHELVTA